MSRFILPNADVGSGISPSSGAKLFFFESGTSTKKDTFSDEALLIANANPVISNSSGVFPDIWLGGGQYKVRLENKNGTQTGFGEADPVDSDLRLTDTVANFDTLALAVASINIAEGDSLNLKERLAGGGGGAMWDVVLTSSVTPNDLNIVASVAIPTLSLVLRSDKMVTLRSIGAIGDDATDDHAAITQAFTLGAPVHGHESDSYRIESPVVLLSGSKFYANGCSINPATTDFDAITATGTVGARLSGILIDNLNMISKYAAPTSVNFIRFTFVDDSVIQNSTFDQNNNGANPCNIYLAGTRNISVIDCHGYRGTSLFMTSNDFLSTGTWGENNKVDRCSLSSPVQGFDLTYQIGARITNSESNGATTTFGAGFLVEFQCIDTIIANCRADSNKLYGYYVEGNIAGGVKNLQIVDCYGSRNGTNNIHFDGNFLDCLVSGGIYDNTTTGSGIFAAGSSNLVIDGAWIKDSASQGIELVAPFKYTLSNLRIDDNALHPISIITSVNSCKFSNLVMIGNAASNTVLNFTYIGGNVYEGGPWEAWTPTLYKANETTTTTPTILDAKFRRNSQNSVEYSLVAVTFSVVLDGSTFFSIPLIGDWTDNSSAANELRSRGVANMNTTTASAIDGAFANDKLRVATTAAGDTEIRAFGIYETI